MQESFILHIKVGWNTDENVGAKVFVSKMECRELGDGSSRDDKVLS